MKKVMDKMDVAKVAAELFGAGELLEKKDLIGALKAVATEKDRAALKKVLDMFAQVAGGLFVPIARTADPGCYDLYVIDTVTRKISAQAENTPFKDLANTFRRLLQETKGQLPRVCGTCKYLDGHESPCGGDPELDTCGEWTA